MEIWHSPVFDQHLPINPYAGDLRHKCQHTEICSADSWASANDLTLLSLTSKGPARFHPQRWNSDANTDLAFAHTVDTGISTRRVLDKFPRSQHRPSWNFRKANWDTFKQMTDVATSQLPPPDTADTEDAYKAFYRIGPTHKLD